MSDIPLQNISDVTINDDRIAHNRDIEMDFRYTDTGDDIASTDFQNDDDAMVGGSSTTENIVNFRHNSLALVTFPWTSGTVMEDRLSTIFEGDHYAFVSGTSSAIYTIIQ